MAFVIAKGMPSTKHINCLEILSLLFDCSNPALAD